MWRIEVFQLLFILSTRGLFMQCCLSFGTKRNSIWLKLNKHFDVCYIMKNSRINQGIFLCRIEALKVLNSSFSNIPKRDGLSSRGRIFLVILKWDWIGLFFIIFRLILNQIACYLVINTSGKLQMPSDSGWSEYILYLDRHDRILFVLIRSKI